MTAAKIVAAVEDATRSWPHNRHLIEDALVEAAVLRAMDPSESVIEDGLDDRMASMSPQPLFRPVKPGLLAIPLGDVLHLGKIGAMSAPCDRCGMDYAPVAGLWVAAGATVFGLEVCALCHRDLDRAFAPVIWT